MQNTLKDIIIQQVIEEVTYKILQLDNDYFMKLDLLNNFADVYIRYFLYTNNLSVNKEQLEHYLNNPIKLTKNLESFYEIINKSKKKSILDLIINKLVEKAELDSSYEIVKHEYNQVIKKRNKDDFSTGFDYHVCTEFCVEGDIDGPPDCDLDGDKEHFSKSEEILIDLIYFICENNVKSKKLIKKILKHFNLFCFNTKDPNKLKYMKGYIKQYSKYTNPYYNVAIKNERLDVIHIFKDYFNYPSKNFDKEIEILEKKYPKKKSNNNSINNLANTFVGISLRNNSNNNSKKTNNSKKLNNSNNNTKNNHKN